MNNSSHLLDKVNRAYILQGIFISLAALLSVFFAKVVLEETLIKEAIRQEADFFWSKYLEDDGFELPHTLNLTGVFDEKKLPEALHDRLPLPAGFQEFDELDLVIYKTSQAGKDLHLMYYREQVDSLAMYYGLFPLAVILIFLYTTIWISYRFSHRIMSPVSWLAQQVNLIDPDASDIKHIDIDEMPHAADDVILLARSISQLGERLDSFIERERNFTRDASHELRSPLTVIRIATDMLQSEQALPAPARGSIEKIRRATDDMEDLTEAFLLLARETDDALSVDKVKVNDIVREEVDRASPFNRNKQIPITIEDHDELLITASDKVLSVLIGNLIRNAIIYTESGSIEITVGSDSLVINDSGVGMTAEQVDKIFDPHFRANKSHAVGHGVGMSIVKRLCDRFGWTVNIDSHPGTGTRVEITFC